MKENILFALDLIRKESCRSDLDVKKYPDGWRLVGTYPDGSIASVGGLGVVPNEKDFYNRLLGFYNGLCSMKRWINNKTRNNYDRNKQQGY